MHGQGTTLINTTVDHYLYVPWFYEVDLGVLGVLQYGIIFIGGLIIWKTADSGEVGGFDPPGMTFSSGGI